MKTPHVSHQRPEDENLGVGANMAYGLQHVLTMYGGIVAVPLIIGQAAGLSPADIGLLIAASLFAGGWRHCCKPWVYRFLAVSCRWFRVCRFRALRPWSRSSAAAGRVASSRCLAR